MPPDITGMRPILLLIAFVLAEIRAAEGPRLQGLALGVGDWIIVKNGDWGSREEYATLPSLSLYGSGWGWQAGLDLPFRTVFKKVSHEARYSLGDGEFSVGKQLGEWSPRLILQVPLYSWSIEDALDNEFFVGSGNVNVGLGLGAKAPRAWLPARWDLAADLKVTAAATRGLADLGSSHATGFMQAGYVLGRRMKAGANLLLLFNYWRWIPDYWDQEGETGFSVMPGIFAQAKLLASTYLGCKAGVQAFEYRNLVKPKYASRTQRSYFFGLSVYQGL